MKYLLLANVLFCLVPLAFAQSETALITELPSCALNCIIQYLPNTACSATDFQCMCATPQLWTNATGCTLNVCTVKEALTAQNISVQVCHTPVRNRSRETEVVGPVLTLFAVVFVAIRVFARQPWKTDLFGWDDGLIVSALAFAIPLGVSHVYLGRDGLGQDIWDVSFDHITRMLRWFYVAEVFYLMATVLTKISILVFYLRVFPSHNVRLVTKILIVVIMVFCISFFFALVFQCWPVSYAWTRWSGEKSGSCININAGTWSHAALNILLDLVILVLPLPPLFKLQLNYSWHKKARIFIMFSFGLIVTIVSILRLRTLILFANTRNPTWDYFGAAIWSIVETMVGIICACLPAAKVFVSRVAPGWLGITVDASRHLPSSAARGAAQKWPGSAGTVSSSSNRLSKPPQRASTVITMIQEERTRDRDDFVPLEDLPSDTHAGKDQIAVTKSWALTEARNSMPGRHDKTFYEE